MIHWLEEGGEREGGRERGCWGPKGINTELSEGWSRNFLRWRSTEQFRKTPGVSFRHGMIEGLIIQRNTQLQSSRGEAEVGGLSDEVYIRTVLTTSVVNNCMGLKLPSHSPTFLSRGETMLPVLCVAGQNCRLPQTLWASALGTVGLHRLLRGHAVPTLFWELILVAPSWVCSLCTAEGNFM